MNPKKQTLDNVFILQKRYKGQDKGEMADERKTGDMKEISNTDG